MTHGNPKVVSMMGQSRGHWRSSSSEFISTIISQRLKELTHGLSYSVSCDVFAGLRYGPTKRRAAPRCVALLKKDKMYCLSLQGLHCILRRAAPQNESWEKFIFHGTAVFRRSSVANRNSQKSHVSQKKNPCLISIQKNRIFKPKMFHRGVNVLNISADLNYSLGCQN